MHFKNTNDNHQLLDLSLESPEKAVIVVVNDEINRFLNFESKLNSLLPVFDDFQDTTEKRIHAVSVRLRRGNVPFALL